MVVITKVDTDSQAARHGIIAGDTLISINNHPIADVLDYRFYLYERVIALKCRRADADYTVRIVKGEYDDIGLSFETPLMSEKQHCKNGCIFCFIDQNPAGMRESIYFKDDDARLSFLHGNYITLTNMTDEDIERILRMHISPINISVHTTDPALRVRMMKNKRAGEVLSYLDRLYDGGIAMCAQVVVCRGINDGEQLLRTMTDLSRYYPTLGSVSVIPAGLTAHRDGLCELSDFTAAEAAALIDMVDAFGTRMRQTHGGRMFFLGDEFYLKAGRPIPEASYYENYDQIENGVGLLRSFEDEFFLGMQQLPPDAHVLPRKREISLATGAASYSMLTRLCAALQEKYANLTIHVYKIINHFFGESITVSGLMTGVDLMEQLRDKPLGDELLLPACALRDGEDVFLCDTTKEQLQDALGVPVHTVDNDGYAFLEALTEQQV